jgi:hypothetical protein
MPLELREQGYRHPQGEGAKFRIVEAFAADPQFYVDTTDTVEKLNETDIRLVRRVFGAPIPQLQHTWSACDPGTHYVTVLAVCEV